MKKTILTMAVAILACLLITSCMSKDEYYESLEDYPNSGDVVFGDISLTIPDGYIRDTTIEGVEEGVAMRWEQGLYEKTVTISRHEQYELDQQTLKETTQEQKKICTGELSVDLVKFHDKDAIESYIMTEEGEMMYLIFNAGDYTYHFSVLGDISDYDTIKDSIDF